MSEVQKDEIIVYGDIKRCSACETADKDFSQKLTNSKKISYSYKPLQEDEAQKYLESKGYKEGDDINIPIIKVCKWKEENGQKKKYCAVENEYKPERWKSLDNDEIPDTLNFSLES